MVAVAIVVVCLVGVRVLGTNTKTQMNSVSTGVGDPSKLTKMMKGSGS
jgi:hypothetical protein